jgi:hypothetical protein
MGWRVGLMHISSYDLIPLEAKKKAEVLFIAVVNMLQSVVIVRHVDKNLILKYKFYLLYIFGV